MKNNYLQHMGITVWQLRKNENNQCASYFYVIFKNAAGKPVGVMLADIDDKIALSEQEDLLRKIASALNSTEAGFTMTREEGRKPVCEQTMNFSLDISLSDLLKNPESKKKLWEEMKLLKKYF
ncbi:MAG: hypothetical protein NTU49_03865 [Gammaproteobacteria bacterium]|nr:hypothetical protein [Gammaproteobacteria bacterium]